jgi:DNA-binding LacI/PurR family transcriptional regulator/anti-anti-sigma regulatory factor
MLQAGVQQVARERNARLLLFQMEPQDVALTCLGIDVIDGWISIYDRLYHSDDPYGPLVRTGRPVVIISEQIPNVPTVITDNVAGMHAVVRHVLELGHRHIAFAGSPSNPDTSKRLDGYRQALAEFDLAFDPSLFFAAPDEGIEGGRAATRQILAAGRPCTAVAYATDEGALGGLEVLRSAGIRVPDDLAITGFDDKPESMITTPPLTTVRMRFDAMGRAAAEHLLDILAGAPPATEPIIVPTELVIRRSAGERSDLELRNPAAYEPGDLAHKLVQIVSAGTPQAPEETLAQLWPGLPVIVQVVESAFSGAEPPDDLAIQHAWESALQIATYADALSGVFGLIESTLEQELSSRPADDPARGRATTTVDRLRTGLLRVCLSNQVQQVTLRESALAISDKVTRDLAASDLDAACRLEWLRGTGVTGGVLALVAEVLATGDLTIAGVYPQPEALDRQPITRRQFPPLDLLTVSATNAPVTVLPLRSAQRDWGILALTVPDELQSVALDTTPLLAALLTARIDSTTLQDNLEKQQAAIRSAYERERALSDAVRELGCPVLPLGTTALLVPLIGVIDAQRAQQIITTVLQAIEVHRAASVLFDITAVPLIDTHVAGLLLNLAQMARLLGAQVMLIGVRPEIAQSIVGLGLDLRGLITHASLADALASLVH